MIVNIVKIYIQRGVFDHREQMSVLTSISPFIQKAKCPIAMIGLHLLEETYLFLSKVFQPVFLLFIESRFTIHYHKLGNVPIEIRVIFLRHCKNHIV